MANSSQRKWKYLSITLGALIATIVLAPQANAANPDHNSILAALAAAVTTIETAISDSADETQSSIEGSISSSADNIQTNVGTVHAISLDDVTIDPTPGVSQSLHVFGAAGGPSNSGQFTFSLTGDLGAGANELTFTCDTSDSGGAEFVFTEEGSYAQDFTCTLFTIIVYDNGAGAGAGPVTVNGLLQYTTATEVTTISADIP